MRVDGIKARVAPAGAPDRGTIHKSGLKPAGFHFTPFSPINPAIHPFSLSNWVIGALFFGILGANRRSVEELIVRLRRSFSNDYHLEEEIRGGSMSRLFRARKALVD